MDTNTKRIKTTFLYSMIALLGNHISNTRRYISEWRCNLPSNDQSWYWPANRWNCIFVSFNKSAE